MNIAVVEGTLSSEPRTRTLPSGAEALRWEVTIRGEGGAVSVPVQWIDAPAPAHRCRAGDSVIVLGMVRRRFYRAEGALVSRTEIVGERLARSTAGRGRARLLADAGARLASG